MGVIENGLFHKISTQNVMNTEIFSQNDKVFPIVAKWLSVKQKKTRLKKNIVSIYGSSIRHSIFNKWLLSKKVM